MSISKSLRDQMENARDAELANLNSGDGGPGHSLLSAETKTKDGVRIACKATTVDRIGVSLESVVCQGEQTTPLTTPKLRHVADTVCKRVNYLLEPLRLIELDGQAGEALIRSEHPHQSADGPRTFYEAKASANHTVEIARFAYDAQAKDRSPAPMNLTNEQFDRLVEDLSDIVKST